jgi:hypothetical protein
MLPDLARQDQVTLIVAPIDGVSAIVRCNKATMFNPARGS